MISWGKCPKSLFTRNIPFFHRSMHALPWSSQFYCTEIAKRGDSYFPSVKGNVIFITWQCACYCHGTCFFFLLHDGFVLRCVQWFCHAADKWAWNLSYVTTMMKHHRTIIQMMMLISMIMIMVIIPNWSSQLHMPWWIPSEKGCPWANCSTLGQQKENNGINEQAELWRSTAGKR